MENYLVIVLLGFILIFQFFLLLRKGQSSSDLNQSQKAFDRMESLIKSEMVTNRQELNLGTANLQKSLFDSLNAMSQTLIAQFAVLSESVQHSMELSNKNMGEKLNVLTNQLDINHKANRDELAKSLQQFGEAQSQQFFRVNEMLKSENALLRDAIEKVFRDFASQVNKNNDALMVTQKEHLSQLDNRLQHLLESNEKKLEQMRETVDEKLQKTLSERLGHSFDMVGKQLENVQKGLGEMQVLAQDVGGLKKVLSNVKMRGGIGEVRLAMLLEQILAPDQYQANVKPKRGSPEVVEFAVKLPGKNEGGEPVWLPIDAKFPQEVYLRLGDAYELGDNQAIESASRELEAVIKKMARDVSEKYIDPPFTTDFCVMFLPFEGVYAEVIRRSDLMEQLQRDFRVVVTGPTTLAAILNSFQMGFKTLAIQQRSGEVWKVLGQVKSEFSKFGGLLEKAQKNLHTATSTIDDLVGTRTKAIERRLRDVEALPIPGNNTAGELAN